jgi:NitT/TauT family transport system permease protein
MRWLQQRRQAVNFMLLLVGLVIAWQGLHLFAGETALSSPADALKRAWRLVETARFWQDVASTFRTFVIALAIAVAGGVVLGLLLGSSRLLGEAAEPILIAFYTIPKVAFFPVILLCFGIGLAAGVVFGMIHGIVPVAIFTMNAVRNVKPVLLRSARVLRLSRLQVWWTIVLPSAVPEIFSGIRIGFSLTFIGTILGEMFGSRLGIGFLLMSAIGINAPDLIMATTVLIVAFAATANAILLAIDHRLHRAR